MDLFQVVEHLEEGRGISESFPAVAKRAQHGRAMTGETGSDGKRRTLATFLSPGPLEKAGFYFWQVALNA